MSDIPEQEVPQAESFATSSIVTTVFDSILADVHEGRLLPGTRISDSDLAEKLGVSRTPVREALQRLREIGIIEASASRFTRISIISPQQTADAMVVWVALYGALVSEVISRVPPEMVLAMRADHDRFVEHLMNPDPQKLATANADFFAHFVTLSTNPALQRGITSVVHQIRLGSLHLPDYIDLRALSVAQDLLVHAARDHDRAAALGSMRMLGLIEIPVEDSEQADANDKVVRTEF
ncbi:GntR family transcriptional regulator [Lacisediminihabitans changchengi]|uniref:GntR family transcriptional regulator n=1 Tax=Lacisediminihabitans changchengi TaxID=2787634 RepID=A0A934SN53_9MICO|nr:GntR family transcriptional regulator [Lacisediminihabitans changchengi]MBK4348598.1 GntR family transcriptional regulator [Lacisediminihabitans changchengi]